jgi:hypothetical protein
MAHDSIVKSPDGESLGGRVMLFATCDLRFAIVLAVALTGCITKPQNPAATQPATDIDPITATPAYWYDQPAVASVTSTEFEPMWKACEDMARDHHFKLDRVDYRLGLLTTDPKVSPQFFEFWRSEIGTTEELAESSLATIRRTARFEFSRDTSGIITMQPKVLVERYSQAERRITSVVQYRTAVAPGVTERGSRERDAGIVLPTRYWYATGRDTVLEVKIADGIQRRLDK